MEIFVQRPLRARPVALEPPPGGVDTEGQDAVERRQTNLGGDGGIRELASP